MNGGLDPSRLPPIQPVGIEIDIAQQSGIVSDADQNVRAGVELLHRREAVLGLLGNLIDGRIGLEEGLGRGFLRVHVLLEPNTGAR